MVTDQTKDLIAQDLLPGDLVVSRPQGWIPFDQPHLVRQVETTRGKTLITLSGAQGGPEYTVEVLANSRFFRLLGDDDEGIPL